MKVLMTTDTVGGVWTYSMELARALAAHDIEVVLAAMGRPLSHDQRLEALDLQNVDIYGSEFKLEWMDDPWPDVDRAGEWLLGLRALTGADVVHLNGYVHATLPWRVPVMVAGHSCVRSWWRSVKAEDAPAAYDEYTSRVTAGLRAADVVVAPTQAMLTELRRHYGLRGDTRVIPNGRDAERFKPSRKQEIIFAAGRLWDEGKNIAALDRVARMVSWPVVIAGDMTSPDGRVRDLKTATSLGIVPPQEIATWVGRASIYALPARYEPFGLSVLEAALAGCALVLGSIPSLREVWGDSAIFVEPGDDAVLNRGLRWLIEKADRRQMLAQRARAVALSLTPERMAASYVHEYRRLLERRAAPAEVACAS
jgi:glycogen(starch) synthase